MYAFIHDLTAAIELPPGGKELIRGLQLGARQSKIPKAVAHADVRHQLFYLELKRIASRVWKQRFGVNCHEVPGSGRHREERSYSGNALARSSESSVSDSLESNSCSARKLLREVDVDVSGRKRA